MFLLIATIPTVFGIGYYAYRGMRCLKKAPVAVPATIAGVAGNVNWVLPVVVTTTIAAVFAAATESSNDVPDWAA
jgi:hypothetical protein